MPQLKDILYKVALQTVSGDMETEVTTLAFDSRKADAGSVFVAVSGTQVDGHDYIETAIQQGAVAIVCERLPETTVDDIAIVQVADSAEALGVMASNLYGNPTLTR